MWFSRGALQCSDADGRQVRGNCRISRQEFTQRDFDRQGGLRPMRHPTSQACYVLKAPNAVRQSSKPLEHEMRRKEHLTGWNLFQRAVTLLLIACVVLLALFATLMWSYLAAISRDVALATSNHAESARALLSMNEQQKASNVRLDAMRGELSANLTAIRDELHPSTKRPQWLRLPHRHRRATLSNRKYSWPKEPQPKATGRMAETHL